jgi:integrase
LLFDERRCSRRSRNAEPS